MKNKLKIIITIIILIIIDTLTKIIFLKKHFLIFNYTENPGIIFGINLISQTAINIIALIILLIWIFYLLKIEKKYNLAISLIIGGLFSNFINRIFLGYVIDFIDIKIIPVFNFADTFILAGIILLIINYKRK